MADFLILGLACWRIANLLTSETGPFEIFPKLRSRVGVKYDPYSVAYGTNEVGKVFACIWCMSVWVGVIVSVLYLLSRKITIWVIGFPFGLSSIVVVLHKFMSK